MIKVVFVQVCSLRVRLHGLRTVLLGVLVGVLANVVEGVGRVVVSFYGTGSFLAGVLAGGEDCSLESH